MRYVWPILLGLVIATSVWAGVPNRDYVDGVLLVRFADDVEILSSTDGSMTVGDATIDHLLKRFNVKSWEPFFGPYIIQNEEYRYQTRNDIKFWFPEGSDMELITAEFMQSEFIAYACPDLLFRWSYEPDDPSYASQWWLRSIDAPDIWDYTKGEATILVVPIDSGVDFNHPDLIDNIWVNPGEDLDDNHYPVDTLMGFTDLPGTSGDWDQLDNDGNGFINDYIGWDWVNGASDAHPNEDGSTPDNNPMDFGGHGTGVSAAMAEVGDNGIGGAGVAYNCKIMATRCGYSDRDNNGYTQLSAAAAGLAYAVDNGATIANMSFGGYSQTTFMDNACQNAWNNGMLLFGAAGNEAVSNMSYPANYDNVISVAAVDNNGARSYFSNWGNWVDIAAPGESCFTAWFDDTYDTWQGTSVASPIAAGVGALVAGWYPNATNSEWANYVINTTTELSTDHPVGSGQVNAYNAVTQFYWPQLTIEEWSMSDPDGNGHPDVGEEIEVRLTVSNEEGWQDALLASARIDFSRAGVNFGNQEILLGNITGGSEINNNSNPLTFTVPAGGLDGEFNIFTLTVTSMPNDYEIGVSQKLMLGTPEVLFVEDCGNTNLGDFIAENLDANWYNYYRWDTNELDSSPSADYLQDYDLVIWMTGNETDPFTTADQTAIQTAMDNGADFFIFGQTIDEQLAGTDFYANYLHAQSTGETAQAALAMIPDAGGPDIPDGQLVLVGPGGAGNNNNPDPITPVNGAVAKATFFNSTNAGIIYYEGNDTKLVYCPFAFEAISGANNTLTRSETLLAIMEWFNIQDTPELSSETVIPSSWAIESVYPNPFNPSTTIRVAAPASGDMQVRVFDLLGREVATLFNGRVNAGMHNFTWQATNQAAGVYFAVMEANGHRAVSKLTLVK